MLYSVSSKAPSTFYPQAQEPSSSPPKLYNPDKEQEHSLKTKEIILFPSESSGSKKSASIFESHIPLANKKETNYCLEIRKAFKNFEAPVSPKEKKNILSTIEILEDVERLLSGEVVQTRHFSAHKRDRKKMKEFFGTVRLAAQKSFENAKSDQEALALFFEVLQTPGCHLKKGNAIIDYALSHELIC